MSEPTDADLEFARSHEQMLHPGTSCVPGKCSCTLCGCTVVFGCTNVLGGGLCSDCRRDDHESDMEIAKLERQLAETQATIAGLKALSLDRLRDLVQNPDVSGPLPPAVYAPVASVSLDPLTQLLIKHEGLRLAAYTDSLGFVSIGVGRMLDGRRDGGISVEEAYLMLANDIKAKKAALDQEVPWWRGLDQVRQDALTDLAFNLGAQGLLGFPHFLACLAQHDYQDAAEALRTSQPWASQVGPTRVSDLVRMIGLGVR